MNARLILFIILSFACFLDAYAGSATWNLDPTSSDWSTEANWTPATVPNGPADVATFDQSNFTDVTLSKSVKVQSIVFGPDASAFTISTGPRVLTFSGVGVINNSQLPQNFAVTTTPGFIQFVNRADAGDAIYTQTGESGGSTLIYFLENASAGSGTFINQGGDLSAGAVLFYGASTAATGTFFNRAGTANGGATDFFESTNAGGAMIVCDGATPDAGAPGFCNFKDSSSAGDATFVVNGGGNSGSGGLVAFFDDAIGEKARVKVYGNGTLNIAGHHSPGLGIGSLEADGSVELGANNLRVGDNNLSTTFAGVISGVGSITKVGSGTLTFTNANAYAGGTVVNGHGALLVNTRVTSGTGNGPVQVNRGILGGNGVIAGAVTIGNGSRFLALIAPGHTLHDVGVLTIQSSLTLNADAIFFWKFTVPTRAADQISAASVTINKSAVFLPRELRPGALQIGQSLKVIDNTGGTAIVGAFLNLPDGATFTIGLNKFQANYEGGDGNDLTLTVVP